MIARNSRAIVRAAFLSLAAMGVAQAQAPVASPRETLSWYGDPSAPDISGLWVRSDEGIDPAGSKEGWTPWPPPLKPAYAAIWKQRVAEAAAGTRTDDPIRRCVPPGMPRFIAGSNGPLQISQLPGMVMLYRDNAAYALRRIWLDRSALPDAKDLESFPHGNSIGHYDGSDLVTEVTGISDRPIDSTGIPHSDALIIRERFHRVDAATLRVEETLIDPIAFLHPITTTVIYHSYADPKWEPKEFFCTPVTDYHPDRFVH